MEPSTQPRGWYEIARDVGFPVLAAMALGWWNVQQENAWRVERAALEAAHVVVVSKMADAFDKRCAR
jgi:hypothetical protein